MLAQQPQRAQNATHQPVEQAGGDAGDAGDRIVRAAHLLEASLEGLGDMDKGQDLRELVAGDDELQPDPRVAQLFVAFEHE